MPRFRGGVKHPGLKPCCAWVQPNNVKQHKCEGPRTSKNHWKFGSRWGIEVAQEGRMFKNKWQTLFIAKKPEALLPAQKESQEILNSKHSRGKVAYKWQLQRCLLHRDLSCAERKRKSKPIYLGRKRQATWRAKARQTVQN